MRESTAASVEISENSPLGAHIHKKRLERGIRQKDAAIEIGVTTETIWNWENGYSEPYLNYYPAIIRFLEYNPVSLKSGTFAQRLYAARVTLGFSYRSLAKFLGVMEETVADWECEKHKPTKKSLELLGKLWARYDKK